MWIRHLVWAFALVAVCLGGCGSEEDAGKPKDDPAPEPKAGEPAKEPEADPWTVVMTFSVDVEGARKAGSIPADRGAKDVLADVTQIVRARVGAADVGQFGVDASGTDRFTVGFEALAKERREAIVALVTRTGKLEFLIEVLPDGEYRKRAAPDDEPPKRLGLWQGSEADFAAYKQREIEAWKKAKAAGEHHKPSMPGYRLVLEDGKDGSEPAHFHVLEEPKGESPRFDGRMLENPVVGQDMTGKPTVIFDIREGWQERLGAWTEANKRMPMAIVLDGVFHSAPTIRERLTTNVQITLGAGNLAELRSQAKQLVAVLQAGALPAAPTLVSIDER